MKARSIKIQESFFSAPSGTILTIHEGTYETQVCDVCGKKKKCDYFSGHFEAGHHAVYMDVCRACQRILSAGVGE